MRYIVIGGNPFKCYTGTTTYTGLSVIGTTKTLAKATQIANEAYEKCGGLLIVVDSNGRVF
jgi:hypothetical protein